MKKLFLFALLSIFLSCAKKNNVIKPVRKDITQAVYASGKIYPVNDYKIYAKLPGYIQTIHVKIGDVVKIGQPLITIRSEVSDKNVAMAKNQYELAEKNAAENSSVINALKQDVKSAKTKYELDSINYDRYKNLSKEDATSQLQLDQSKAQFEISKQNFLKSYNNLITTNDRLKTELENAKLQLESQNSNRSEYIIASAVGGKVYDIVPKEGELVNNMLMLMEVGDENKFQVELSIDETDVSFIRQNQDIVYTIDAYKNKIFNGKVVELYPRINQLNKTSKVIAGIELDKSVIVFSGMSVEANIIFSKKNNALVIPREFLFEDNKIIRKIENDTLGIQKGVEDLEFVEILGKVNEETEIVKP